MYIKTCYNMSAPLILALFFRFLGYIFAKLGYSMTASHILNALSIIALILQFALWIKSLADSYGGNEYNAKERIFEYCRRYFCLKMASDESSAYSDDELNAERAAFFIEKISDYLPDKVCKSLRRWKNCKKPKKRAKLKKRFIAILTKMLKVSPPQKKRYLAKRDSDLMFSKRVPTAFLIIAVVLFFINILYSILFCLAASVLHYIALWEMRANWYICGNQKLEKVVAYILFAETLVLTAMIPIIDFYGFINNLPFMRQ